MRKGVLTRTTAKACPWFIIRNMWYMTMAEYRVNGQCINLPDVNVLAVSHCTLRCLVFDRRDLRVNFPRQLGICQTYPHPTAYTNKQASALMNRQPTSSHYHPSTQTSLSALWGGDCRLLQLRDNFSTHADTLDQKFLYR